MAEQLMSIPEIYEPLRRGTTDPDQLEREERGRSSRVGRARMKGDIAPVALAYMIGRAPEMQHYHGNHLSSLVWEKAGWERAPSYGTFWGRIVEGEEEHVPAWEAASRTCWRKVRRELPEAGLDLIIDGTPYQAHVQAHHDCLDPIACAAAGGAAMPEIIQRAGQEGIDADRHARQEAAPPEDDAEPLALTADTTREELLSDLAVRLQGSDDDFEEASFTEAYPEPELPKYRRKRLPRASGQKLYKEIFIGDGPSEDENTYRHRYVIRDPDAGFRIYRRPDGRKFRQWLGGYAITITDACTGCQIGQFHIPFNTRRIRQINGLLRIGQVSGFRVPHHTIKKRSVECPRFGGHLSAWSAVSDWAGRIVRHAKGIELQEAVPAGVSA